MHFIDLQAQYQAYRSEIDAAIKEVVESARFIHGPKVTELEEKLAAFTQSKQAIGFSSGTQALWSTLQAWEIGPGDEVITTPFTFIATAEVIALLGAKTVFVDIDDETLNLDVNQVEAAITPKTKAILPVNLYGQCVDYDQLMEIAEKHQLLVLEDACQSMGSTYKGRPSCGLAHAGATSFFPAKPLGCFGDGGMTFTNDEALAEKLRQIRDHGQTSRYRHEILGNNGRLDALQAAVLLAKLPHFNQEIKDRQRIAQYYINNLPKGIKTQTILPENESVYAQFTIRLPERRDEISAAMNKEGIPTAIHYPMPLHQQPVFSNSLDIPKPGFPVAETASKEVLSLPMHPFLTPELQDKVIEALKKAL
ncbi:DegT/DnrJ/EryC1/StrS family aminotransferase [Magnetococcales bacterium HHB-1]